MAQTREKPIPEYKTKLVDELKNLISTKKTILIASIKNLPGSQFQEISKKIRDKAILKVPKKSLFLRAIEGSKKGELQKLKEYYTESTAILFSDMDGFELSAILLRNKSKTKAKTGQEASEDIKIEAGPTDLPPGPAISELGSVGLQVMVQDGKISIKESKVIVKKGQIIKQNAADVMSKLGIKPFSIGFIPLSSFDSEEDKLYVEININTEEAVSELKNAYGKALPFAVNLGYAVRETIGFMLAKANTYASALVKLSSEEKPKEEVVEEKTEEAKPEENNQTPEETPQGVPSEEGKTDGEEK